MFKTNLLDEVETDNFALIGIYSTCENYRISFFLNELLGWQFKRLSVDLGFQFKDTFVQFPLFKSIFFKDQIGVYLINNQIKVKEQKKINYGLFNQDLEKTNIYTLLPELKNLDYILKIEDVSGRISTQEVTKKINQANFDAKARLIPNNQLKSKAHLIIN